MQLDVIETEHCWSAETWRFTSYTEVTVHWHRSQSNITHRHLLIWSDRGLWKKGHTYAHTQLQTNTQQSVETGRGMYDKWVLSLGVHRLIQTHSNTVSYLAVFPSLPLTHTHTDMHTMSLQTPYGPAKVAFDLHTSHTFLASQVFAGPS